MNIYDNVNVNMRVNMEDKELVECLTSLKRRKTLLFFLILVINGLICIGANIGLDTFKIIFIFIGVQMAFYGKHTHTLPVRGFPYLNWTFIWLKNTLINEGQLLLEIGSQMLLEHFNIN